MPHSNALSLIAGGSGRWDDTREYEHSLPPLSLRAHYAWAPELRGVHGHSSPSRYPTPASPHSVAANDGYPPAQGTITELYFDPTTKIARVQWSKGDAPRGFRNVRCDSNRAAGGGQLSDLQRGSATITSRLSGYVMNEDGESI